MWEKISIEGLNDALKNATIHYSSTGPDDTGSDPDEDPDRQISPIPPTLWWTP